MLDLSQIAQFQERRGTHGHVLLWIVARNRSTGVDEGIGLWSGDDHQEFSIDGATRLYYGAGTVIEVPPVQAAVGLDVRMHRVILPPFMDEVRQALRVYDPRGARVEIHAQPFDLDSNTALGSPVRFIKGTLDTAPEGLERAGSQVELQVASAARALTRGLPLHRTQAALAARTPGDLGRAYIDTVGEWSVPWGEE